jgi:hypothetical protein
MIKTSDIIKDLKKVAKTINQIPTVTLYKEYGSYHSETVLRKFGSWNKALTICFNNVVRNSPKPKILSLCKNCGKETKNPKYCSRSCAAKINGQLFPKHPKHPRKLCIYCSQPTTAPSQICKKCKQLKIINSFGEKTIQNFESTYARHKYQKIRNHAHRVAKYYKIPKLCAACQYNIHTELCHKKPIHKFSKQTTLNIVNDPLNLVYLCRNHHWELEHGLLTIP